MNDHEADLVGAYVLGALPPDEEAAFEAHLAECAVCRQEVAELRDVVDVLPLAAPAVEPSSDLKGRIMTAVEEDSPRQPVLTPVPAQRPARRWLTLPSAALVAAALLLAVGLGAWNLSLQRRVHDQQTALTFHQRVEAALAGGASVTRIKGTSDAPGASAALVQPRDRGNAFLIVQRLPATPSSRVYQLWLIHGATPRNAGTFTYSGTTAQVVQVPLSSNGYSATAVTVEPGPHGSRAPTGKKLLLGSLRA